MNYDFQFKFPHLSRWTDPVIWTCRSWDSASPLERQRGIAVRSAKTKRWASVGHWCGRVPLRHRQGALPSPCRCGQYSYPSEIFQKTVSTWPTSSTGQKKKSSLFHLSVPSRQDSNKCWHFGISHKTEIVIYGHLCIFLLWIKDFIPLHQNLSAHTKQQWRISV